MEMSVRDNWWDLPYKGPCGASTEIYYLLDKEPVDFQTSVLPNLSLEEKENYIDKNVMEIWNNVFMEYIGVREGRESEPKDLEKLENKNVDTGVGFERVLAVLNGGTNVYQTDVLAPLVAVVDKWSGS
jgi:alanyl-tRNA synthetase